MASYYPEGECYFRRSSLTYSGGFSAERERDFYSHVLLEYQWNGWRAINQTSRSHARSAWNSGTGQFWNTRFGDWNRFWVGESRVRNPDQCIFQHGHANSLNWNECRDLDRGGPRKYILRPVRIHSQDAQWLWIDATIPLRAIYFPVVQTTDQAFPNLCTYVVIDFRHRTYLDIFNVAGFSQRIQVNTQDGLGYRDDLTWGFNIPNIITYLTIPSKLRNPDQGLFKTKVRGDELVVCANSNRSWAGTFTHTSFFREMDMADILSATFGVEVGWRPFEYSSFLKNIILQVVELGLGFIPGAGPILSVAFGIAVQLLQDPASFHYTNVLDLSAAVLETLISSSGNSRKYLAPQFLANQARDDERKQIPLTDEERAHLKDRGEEINNRLTRELDPQVVILSLLEQQRLLFGEVHGERSPLKALENETAQAGSDDTTHEIKVEGDNERSEDIEEGSKGTKKEEDMGDTAAEGEKQE
ncbi:hypothetical protein FHETE_9169 [Fusarium heterosporum]|uniref:Uncharacterized protein n=1 Tax=Fusarium heterosporum TaxID=42747 RepID=A0A8H5T030_FUSHE|nr:hypothetical protein FHETE_9169 [Fusarium heterosporum]